MFTIFAQCMLNFGNGWLYLTTGTMPVWNDYPWRLYLLNIFPRVILYIFGRFTSLKLDVAVVCLSFTVIMERFGNETRVLITWIKCSYCFILHVFVHDISRQKTIHSFNSLLTNRVMSDNHSTTRCWLLRQM